MLNAKYHRQQAWKLMQNNWGVMALVTIIYYLIMAVCGGLSYNPKAPYLSAFSVMSFVISGPLVLGYTMLTLKVIRYQDAKVEGLFEGFKNFLRAFLLALINGILIFLWSLLLIVPGIIKSLSYSMSYFILADNPWMSSNDARKQSMEVMEGNKWRLFCLHLSFIGWWILCALTFGILAIWVVPYHRTAVASFYQSVVAQRPQSSYNYN